jgi:hypothetical protein
MRVRQAMNKLGMESEGSPGAIHGKSKRSFMKNRWSASVAVDISPTTDGSIAVCRCRNGWQQTLRCPRRHR